MASEHSARSGPYALLLTGAPGVGKTTVIRRVAAQLEMRQLRGFYTEEIREGGERQGFRLLAFQGQERVIAHTAFPKSHRVGKYGADVAAIDEAAALLAPDPAARAYLVDEIGKMECLSERFVSAMRMLLAGQTPTVATVLCDYPMVAPNYARQHCELAVKFGLGRPKQATRRRRRKATVSGVAQATQRQTAQNGREK